MAVLIIITLRKHELLISISTNIENSEYINIKAMVNISQLYLRD